MNFLSVSSDGRITQWTIVKVNTIAFLKYFETVKMLICLRDFSLTIRFVCFCAE